MIYPGITSLKIICRSAFDYAVQFKTRITPTADPTPVDLTGKTLVAQLWDRARANKYCDLTITYVDRPTGVVSFSLTDLQTADLPQTGVFDVKELTSDFYYLKGTFVTEQGYSDG